MSARKPFIRFVSAVMTILFVVWTYYQFNDPDALLWIMVYGIAAIASALFTIDRLPALLPILLGGVCIVWAAFLSFQITYEPPLILIEEWREMTGLIIVALTMGAMGWPVLRKKRKAVHAESEI